MTAYHLTVLLIIIAAMVVASRLFPGRPLVQFFGGIGIAMALAGVFALGLYLYFLATGEA